MKKYYIGLLAIAALTLGLTVFTIVQGLKVKQDNETYRRAREIETKLNSYVDRQQKIPESLNEADINDVPSTIRYTKKGTGSYEFCATYKQASSSSLPDIDNLGPSLLGLGGVANPELYSSLYDEYPSSSRSRLFIPSSYKKGDNCQTVTPYFYPSLDNPRPSEYCSTLDPSSQLYPLLCDDTTGPQLEDDLELNDESINVN